VNQPIQKDLDSTAADRHQAQVMAYRERIEANRKAHAKLGNVDDTFVKDVAEAKDRAMNLDPITDSQDSHPASSAVGGIAGAIVDAVAGLGEVVDPIAEDAYWQRAFITEPYFNRDYSYDDYGPAYRMGYLIRSTHADRSWDEVEPALTTVWEKSKGESRLTWEEAREAGQSAWHHAGSSIL
jgi:hypothetical protein